MKNISGSSTSASSRSKAPALKKSPKSKGGAGSGSPTSRKKPKPAEEPEETTEIGRELRLPARPENVAYTMRIKSAINMLYNGYAVAYVARIHGRIVMNEADYEMRERLQKLRGLRHAWHVRPVEEMSTVDVARALRTYA